MSSTMASRNKSSNKPQAVNKKHEKPLNQGGSVARRHEKHTSKLIMYPRVGEEVALHPEEQGTPKLFADTSRIPKEICVHSVKEEE